MNARKWNANNWKTFLLRGKFVIDFSCSLLQPSTKNEAWRKKLKKYEHFRNSRKELEKRNKQPTIIRIIRIAKRWRKMEIVKAQLVRDFQNTILHWHEANKTGKSRQNQIEYWALRKRDDFVPYCLPLVDFHLKHFSKRCSHHRFRHFRSELSLRVFFFWIQTHIFPMLFRMFISNPASYDCWKMKEK